MNRWVLVISLSYIGTSAFSLNPIYCFGSFTPCYKYHPEASPLSPSPPSTYLDRLSWGIFEIAYERSPSISIDPGKWLKNETYRELCYAARSGLVLIAVLFRLDFLLSLRYFLCVLWGTVSPGISLIVAYHVLNFLMHNVSLDSMDHQSRDRLLALISIWLSCGILTSYTSREVLECKELLGGHLRAHFLPILVDVRLQHVKDVFQKDKALVEEKIFPSRYSFGNEVPGWTIIDNLVTRFKDTFTLAFELLAFMDIVTRSQSADAQVLSILGIAAIFAITLAPSNGAGGAGYTFWTKNEHYQRLLSLYSIAFDDDYKESLVKDDLVGYISNEYKVASKALGAVKSNTLALACHLPPPWYWHAIQILILDYPMALYALLIQKSFTIHSVAAMATLQYAINLLFKGAIVFKAGQSSSMHDVLKEAGDFLHSVTPVTLSPVDEAPSGRVDPGRRIEVIIKAGGPVSCSVNGRPNHITTSPDFVTIKKGDQVLLLGGTRDERSSYLKQIAAQFDPRKVAYLSQDEAIYPLTLQENLLGGSVYGKREKLKLLRNFKSKLGMLFGTKGTRLWSKLEAWKQLAPCRIVGQSIQGCGNGVIGTVAIDELKKNDEAQGLSDDERHSVTSVRCLIRATRPETEVIILDDPPCSFSPETIRDLVSEFQATKKTLVMVSQWQFRHLAPDEANIMFMRRESRST